MAQDNPINQCAVKLERRFPNLTVFAGVDVGGRAASQDDPVYKRYLKTMTERFNKGLPPGSAAVPVTQTVNKMKYEKLFAISGIQQAECLVGVQQGVCVSYWFVGNPARLSEFHVAVGNATVSFDNP